jgi:hypothetical protein
MTAKARVPNLSNAISDLHEGDLLEILKLDDSVPIRDICENDTFELTSDGVLVWNQTGRGRQDPCGTEPKPA